MDMDVPFVMVSGVCEELMRLWCWSMGAVVGRWRVGDRRSADRYGLGEGWPGRELAGLDVECPAELALQLGEPLGCGERGQCAGDPERVADRVVALLLVVRIATLSSAASRSTASAASASSSASRKASVRPWPVIGSRW